MRSPTTVGEPCPPPGIWALHRTLFVSFHSTGGAWPGAAMPSRVGPRHSGQSVAGSGVRLAALAARVAAIVHNKIESAPANTWRAQEPAGDEVTSLNFRHFVRCSTK